VSNTQSWTAPAGRRISAVTATTVNPITGGSTTAADAGSNYFVLQMSGTVGPNATPDSRHANTFTGTLDYSSFNLPTLTTEASHTVHLLGPNPVITAMFGTTTIAGGASSATTTTDVTFRLGGVTSQVPLTRDITPEYVFMAPEAWNITQGSASFPAGSVPPGVNFTYRTVTVAGVPRQVVVASWPQGTVFGENTGLPVMSVIARPSADAPVGTPGVARGFITNTNSSLTGDVFTNEFTDIPNIDGSSATTRFSEANAPAGVPVAAVAAMQVLKEICFPDASQPDGCRWFSDPNNTVGVPPNSTSIRYRVSVTNTGNTALSDVVGYDVLPYVGDTGTSDASGADPRGSTFREEINSVSTPTNGATVSFSDATQPCRPEVDATVPGCVDDWDATASGAQAIRIARAGELAAGASFSVMYDAAVIDAPGFGAVACNSFAVRATGLGNVSEPEPVCASVEETDLEVVAGVPQIQNGRPGVLPWTVTNHGGAPSSQAEVKVTIPAGLEVTSFTPAGWTCTAVDGAGNPVFGTAVGPATLTCTPTSPLLRGVPQALNVPVRATTESAVTSLATVSGRLFDGDMDNNTDQMSVAPTAAAGDVGVTKDDGVASAKPGDVLTYTITVTNPLDFETLVGGALSDVLPPRTVFVSASDGGTESNGTVTWSPLPDIPHNGTITRTVTVRVSSTINTATLVNTASVSVPDPANPAARLTGSDDDVDTVVTRPEIELVKGSVPLTFAAVGDVVTYTFAAHNSGDVTLSGVVITDPLPGLSAITYHWPTLAVGVLAPGERVTAEAQYTITQADIDAGRVLNTATVAGRAPDDAPVQVTDSHEVTSTAVPVLSLTKSGAGSVTRAGDVITYTFVATNEGPITLTGVVIADPLPRLSALAYQWPSATAGVLAPGESVTATATYAVSQADVDAGQRVNTATATGRSTTGVDLADDATFTFPIVRTPDIAFDKDGAYRPGDRGEAGDTIDYEFTATNTGNVTLTDVVVTDPLSGLTGLVYEWPGAEGVLTPGQSVVVRATYTVTQADVDGAGSVTNTATVDGRGPDDAPVHGEDTVTLQTPADAGIQIVKTGRVDGEAPVQAGDVVRYRFDVTNLGVVTLHAVELEDLMEGLSDIDLDWPGEDGVLAPGATLVGMASYTLVQADIDAGQVVNTATTTGTPPREGDAPVVDDDTLTIVLPAAAEVTLDKTATIGDGVWHEGDVVGYRFVIVNTGNVTLRDVQLTDPMPGLSQPVFDWPGEERVLAPGESATGTARYILTATDAASRTLSNTATVTTDRGATATDEATVTGPPPPPASALAQTGVEPLSAAITAMMLLLGGLITVIVTRRRREEHTP